MKKRIFLSFSCLCSFVSYSQLPPFNVTVYDSSKTIGYYFLSAPINGTTNLIILDKFGGLVCYKPLPFGSVTSNFSLKPNGILAYASKQKYYLMDSAFRVIDSLKCKNNYQSDTHDQLLLSNGHFLLLGDESFSIDLKKHPDLKKRFTFNTLGVRAAVIQEQDASHNVVFEWHAKDHFDFDDVDTFFFRRDGLGPWTHCNALALDTDGNILLSVRNFNEITKINRTDGSIMWRWGGRCNEFKFVNCPIPFYGQHDIRRIENGHFTIFDNGEYVVTHGAQAMEFELDETNKIAKLIWSYTYDSALSSNGQGNVQRLYNSNTLVNYGRISCDDVCFVVVDSNGSKIFQLDGTNTYRVFNYPSLSWQLRQPQITRRDSSGAIYLEAEAGFNSYSWSDGSNGRIIQAKLNSTYYVFVPYGEGAYLSSTKIVVKN